MDQSPCQLTTIAQTLGQEHIDRDMQAITLEVKKEETICNEAVMCSINPRRPAAAERSDSQSNLHGIAVA